MLKVLVLSVFCLLGRNSDGAAPVLVPMGAASVGAGSTKAALVTAGRAELRAELASLPLGVDVVMMLLGGFGYLMTFLKRNGLGAVGLTMIITAVVTQVAFIVTGLTRMEGEFVIKVGFKDIIEGFLVAATVLISYGALLGKVSIKRIFLKK